MKSGKAGEFYNIGSNYNLDNLTVVKKLIFIAKKKISLGKNVKIKFVKDRPGHDFRYALNSKKIYKELKWKKKKQFNEGIKETIEWYMNNLEYFKTFKKKDIIERMGIK